MRHTYKTSGVCAVEVSFDLEGDKVKNISFKSGCNGNLKALSKVLEGASVDFIEEKLKGNTCGWKTTSCADQLAIAVRKAYENHK